LNNYYYGSIISITFNLRPKSILPPIKTRPQTPYLLARSFVFAGFKINTDLRWMNAQSRTGRRNAYAVRENGYRFTFNGQERTDEIKGIGNHNTALYWEYDTRLGRRWNLDPKPNTSISGYATFANNPIMYVDILGDSISANFSKVGQKESYSERAFKAFLGTKEGYNYLSKFAAKGQTLCGVTFESDGEYHNKGIDLNFSNFSFTYDEVICGAVYDKPRGEAFDRLEGGRLKLDVKLNYFIRGSKMTNEFSIDYDDAIKSKNIKKMDNILIMQRVQTLTHETFIHVNYSVMSKLGVSFKKYFALGYGTDHYTEHMNSLNNVNTMFNTEGFNLLNGLNQKYKTGWKSDRVWNSMWNFQY
jgi:hypothetical protein